MLLNHVRCLIQRACKHVFPDNGGALRFQGRQVDWMFGSDRQADFALGVKSGDHVFPVLFGIVDTEDVVDGRVPQFLELGRERLMVVDGGVCAVLLDPLDRFCARGGTDDL